jgi:aspartate aminotransferase
VVSAKVQRQMLEGSWIRQMFEQGIKLRKLYGDKGVYDLSLGNPVIEPPRAFGEALKELVSNPISGMHRYMPNAGYSETREAVASQLAAETGMPFTMEQVVMTCGAGGGLNVVLKAILDPHDEVIIFAPYFAEFPYYVDNHGGKCRVAPTDENFLPDLVGLEKIISNKTRAILVNSPNNPTGVVYGHQLLVDMGRLLQEKERVYGRQIFLLSDEPYRRLIYDGLAYNHVYPYHPTTIAVTSYSKDLSLPGERIGYIAVNPECPESENIVSALIFCNRTLGFVNAPALMQHVLNYIQGVTVDVADYQRKRDYVYDCLISMGYTTVKPQGAFYFFPSSPLSDEIIFVQMLLEQRVIVVPGRGFGTPGHFRISYCVDDEVLQGSMEAFARVAKTLNLDSA